jgi:hypothetical protein
MAKLFTPEEAMVDALSKHPDCNHATWVNGLTFLLELTIVVHLWRNEECYLADDPPKYTIEGYLMKREEVK